MLHKSEEEAFLQARESMIRTQLAARGIHDQAVLTAMMNIKRHLFVPASHSAEAYADRALPINAGQTISQPFIVALMTELLEVRAEHRVLDVGTGSGYQAAILAELAAEVISIERHPELAQRARKTLKSLGYQHIKVVVGDGSLGDLSRGLQTAPVAGRLALVEATS